MIFSLNIAALTQLRLIAQRSLRKPMRLCQALDGVCISPTADHLSPLVHPHYCAAGVSSPQQNCLEISVIRAWVSKFGALTLAVTLGVSCLFATSPVWATCSGNPVISQNVTAAEKLTLQLCSLTVDSGGSISSPIYYGIANGGTITTLTNAGSISATGASSYGVLNSGTITTLNNTGMISVSDNSDSFSIRNYSIITTLNNQQGAGSVSGALTYTGVLPTNYNIIIINSSTYGRLSATAVTGTMVFGVSSLSTAGSSIINSTLSAVLRGITSAQLGLGGATSYSATFFGYTFTLSETDSVNHIWNLTITSYSSGESSDSTSSIAAGTSVSLSSVGATANPVLSGGTLVLGNGDNSSLAFTVSSAGGTITSPSGGSATLSGIFSGVGGLTFNGTGTTIFTGANTYSGGTTVASGTLSIAGASPTGTGDVLIASAGTLMGTGTIAGNLSVGGVIKPGNSPGYLVASRNVWMNTGSTYQQDIAGLTQASSTTPLGATGYYSLLSVGGQFTINSGTTLTPRLSNLFNASESGYGSAIYVPALGDRFR
ncbi:autotransporter-associated beta strand repeat-containing protein, partial [Alcaligenaceae bacterium LF4-65]